MVLIAIAIATIVSYVRNIAAERNMAERARATAMTEHHAAEAERDRAQLSEATVWLEKDPSHALALLQTNHSSVPQRAFLLTRAEDRAAKSVLRADSRIDELQVDLAAHEAAVVTSNGTLYYLDLARSTLRVADHDLTGPLVRHQGQWCYARQTGEDAVLSPGCRSTAPLGKLLRNQTGKLISSGNDLYVLEAGDLLRIEPSRLALKGKHIQKFAASAEFSILCTDSGELKVTQDGRQPLTSTCVRNEGEPPLTINNEHYVALARPDAIFTDRGMIRLPTSVASEVEIAMSEDGQIALAEVAGEAWVVPVRGEQAQHPVPHDAHPTTTAAAGSLVAFGYSDGVVVVIDMRDRQTWTFIGHSSLVTSVIIDLEGHRMISAAGDEIRIWSLQPPNLQIVQRLPCRPFHIAPLQRTDEYATDCSDGRVTRWPVNREVREAREIHHHRDLSFGIAIWHDKLCTGGWDGRVLCTPIGGGSTEEFLQAPERVKWLVACEDRGLLVVTADGSVWQSSGKPRLLYKHPTSAFRLAVDASCQHLASVAYDGSLIVYDLVSNRIIAQAPHAHDGAIMAVQFRGDGLVTAGADARVKQWRLTDKLELEHATSTSGAVGKFRAFESGWAASVDEQTIALYAEESHVIENLYFSHPISDIALSPDQRYVAFAALDEIAIVDRQQHAIASTHRSSSDINCLQFIAPSVLAACDTASVLALNLDQLNFVPLH
jgi:WD40 repeat protein